MVHGSALFQTGETQSLATATIGSPEDEQRMQGLLDADNRRLIVHFTFPPYASNNVRSWLVAIVGANARCECLLYSEGCLPPTAGRVNWV